jgi:hypothetical protein
VEVKADDFQYPLDKKTFEDPFVFYHGTSSSYSEYIEKKGWKLNQLPFDIKDVVKICDYFETLGYDEEANFAFSNLKSFSLGGDNIYVKFRPTSFSGGYWLARTYAGKLGGETMKNLFQAIQLLLEFTKNKEKRIAYVKKISIMGLEDYFQSLGITDIKKCIKNIENESLISKIHSDVTDIASKYKEIKKSFPVVYAVRIKKQDMQDDSGQFSNYWENDLDYTMGEKKNLVLEVCTKSNVLKDAIIARIDFPNGVAAFRADFPPLPLPWKK